MTDDELRALAQRMNPDNWRCDVCGKIGGPSLIVEIPKNALVEFEHVGEDEIVPKVPKFHPWCRPQFYDSERN